MVNVAVLAAGAWLFGGIAEDVLTGDPIVALDLETERWFHYHQTPWLTGHSQDRRARHLIEHCDVVRTGSCPRSGIALPHRG